MSESAAIRIGGAWGASLLALIVIWILAFGPQQAFGAAVCESTGAGAGQCANPQGIATDFETERVFVADADNNRVDVFNVDGSFEYAFGWGVDTGDPEAQTCTTASGCQAGIAGAGAGQFSKPSQIAVDNVPASATRHDVYVGTDNLRVQRFEADGTFVVGFGWGVLNGAAEAQTCTTGSGCQAGNAVVSSEINECQITGTTRGIAVGPGGNLFLADPARIGSKESEGWISRVEKFSPAGACLEEVKLFGPTLERPKQNVRDLAVDAAEDAYVSVEAAGGELRKYDLGTAETKLCDLDPGISTSAVTIDEAGNVFAAQRELDAENFSPLQVLTEYDGACNHLRRFAYGQIGGSSPPGIAAFHNAGGDVFVNEGAAGVPQLTIPPPGPIIAPGSAEVVTVGNTKATVKAEVNPEGKATDVHAEYLTQAAFIEQGGFEGPATKSTTPQELSVAVGREFRVNGAEVLLGCATASEEAIENEECLTPETEYAFRVIATNADNPSGAGEGTVAGEPFETKEPVEISELFATDVGSDSATLNALVNPLGIPASGHFEYVSDAKFKEDGFTQAAKAPDAGAGEAELDLGGEEAPKRNSLTVFPLAAATTYHYLFSAIDALIKSPILSVAKTFTTFAAGQGPKCPGNEAFRAGAAAALPDCRAYELVSPLDKSGGDVVALEEATTHTPGTLNQSSNTGAKLAYGSHRAFGDAKGGQYTAQYIAARGAGGWASHGVSPPRGEQIKALSLTLDTEFRSFSEDLCESWLTPFAEPPLAAGAIAGFQNLYHRLDSECGGKPDYEALTTVQPPNSGGPEYFLELQGLSAEGAVAAFVAGDNLTANAPAQPAVCVNSGTGCQPRLYLNSGGDLRFACILPGGAASPGPCTAGSVPGIGIGLSRSATVANALSADGARVFWTDSTNEGKIYLRENPFGEGAECGAGTAPCTIAVSEGGEIDAGTSASRYWGAAKDGSKALFTSGGNLYEFELEGEVTKRIAAGVSGVVGASEDANRVYFAASEAIAGSGQDALGEEAQAGKPNLYLHEAGAGSGTYRFIGTFSAQDPISVLPGSPLAFEPRFHSARVSPDGLHAAFTSAAAMTGYDNADAVSGAADKEVFLYDASAEGGAGKLLCASCNPSGARPAGALIGLPGSKVWTAAQIPAFENTLYAARILAADGSHLYFESQDALSPRDSNGKLDVYQWEAVGAGGCRQATPSFSATAGGCVDLISSGQSVRDAEIVDASPSGNDLFFATLASLVPEDYGLVDIYDARVDGGLPSPPAAGIECEGETCQNPAPAPARPPAASATYEGPEDIPAQAKPNKHRCPKGKHRVTKHGKSRCVKNKHKKNNKQKRHRHHNNRRAGR